VSCYEGKINAVDDGIPFVTFLGIFTFFVGQDWWNNILFGSYKYSFCLVIFIWVAGVSK